jgi:hypothetical protein
MSVGYATRCFNELQSNQKVLWHQASSAARNKKNAAKNVAAFQVPQSPSLTLGRFTTVNLSLGWLYFRQPYRKAAVFILY